MAETAEERTGKGIHMENGKKGTGRPDKPEILIVEDDRQMVGLYKTLFETKAYPFRIARSAKEALSSFMSRKADLILLDLGLPDLDGQAVIEKIRSFSSTPILVISARDEDAQKVKALDAGADDYLSKPFSVDELLARIRVIERRIQTAAKPEEENIFINGPLKIVYDEQTVFLDDVLLHLTPIEYKLVVLFSKNAGKVLTHNYIGRQIWGYSFDEDNTNLRVYMTMLRKKLNSELIETCFGVGYKMNRLQTAL